MGAGATGVVVDWERRGKRRRQAGADTQINADTPTDLAAVRAAVGDGGLVLCRVNGWGPWTAREIDLALDLGADEILLPMVRDAADVDAALAVVGGRGPGRLGILVETVDALRDVESLLAGRPLARVYLGLNDLRIDRRARCLFTPLVDGTADRVAAAARAAGVPFGVAGLTVPEGGKPVPCRLLNAALARVGASFTFLRRSFHADVAGRDVPTEVRRILAAASAASARPPEAVDADHAELEELVGFLSEEEAV
ncbi:MAG: aldolase/citrate lyase family protein [Acidimicrobiia bacterium]